MATPTNLDGVPGYGANYGAANSYDLRFGRVDGTTLAQTPIIDGFDVGANSFVAMPRAVPTPYDRVIVNRVVTPAVDNLNKFTGFFSNNGLVGGVPDGAEVFFQSRYIATIESIINSYDIDRGADNVFANAASVATKNNIQRIDMINNDPIIVGNAALSLTGMLLLERGGNDQLTVAAITAIDPVTGTATALGPLVKTAGPLGAIWGNTGISRSTTVFQNSDNAAGQQDIRPDQNLSSQAISGTFISLSALGISAGQPVYGLAVFGNDVVASMDLLGLTDVPLDTDGTANGGLDLMGGGGFFYSAGLELIKSADVPTYASVGDLIEYSFTVTNTSGVTLTNVQVNDPMLGGVIACVPSVLLAGDSASCGPVAYTVTQADIDAGQIINVATASGTDPDGEEVFAIDNETVTGPAPEPDLEVEKLLTNAPDPVFAGDTLEFTITATNTGNITLSDVEVNDPLLTPSTELCPTLAPMATCVLTGTYTVTQADIDAGTFVNLATATAPNPNDPNGPPLEDEDEVTTPLPIAPDIELIKSITSGSPYATVGDTINYQLVATNTGNVALSNVTIVDPLLPTLNCTPAQPATLAPTESLVCSGSYSVDQDDIDNGSVVNTATASGTDPNDQSVEDDDSETADGPANNPALSLVKALTDAPDPIVAGSVLQYTVTATNTGNITLTNVVVNDPLLTPNTQTCPSIAPTATCVLTGTLTVTQAQIDAGEIVNTATGDSDETDEQDDTVTTPVDQNPALSLVKALTDAPDPIVAGSVLQYTVTATNTGNITLTNVVVNDPLLTPNTQTCPSVAPTATCVLTGTLTVTQAQIDAGEIVNTATGDSDETDEQDDTVTTPVGQNPALSLVKALIDAPDPIVAGSLLQYTVTATNTGNITLTNVVVNDPLLTPNTQTCPSVAPTATCVLTGTLTATQAQIDAGEIVNTATADSDETDEQDDTVTTPVDQNPALSLVKALTDAPDPIVAGSVLQYTVTATNTGNITLTNVVVNDPLLTPNTQTCPSVAPTATCVLTGTLTVTQAQIDAGEIVNTATGDSDETDEQDDTVTTPVGQNPALSLVKALIDAPDPIVAGSVLQYTVTATNTGNITLTNVVVNDPLLTPNTQTCPTLAPTATCVLTGTLTATQAQIDAGEIVNTATGDSDETDEQDDTVTTPVGQNPALSLVKALIDAPDPIVAGSVLQYTVTATNTGNITLTNVVVNDPLLTPNTQTCPTLAPTATCVLTGTLTVTQAQIDAGEIVNTATGDSDETDEQDDTVTTPVGQNPALSLVKALTDAPDPIVAGSVLQYTVTATNTGNITLTNVVVNDPLLTPDTQTCPTLAPSATCVLTGTLTVTQAQIDAGEIVNTATGDSDETDEQEDTVTTPVGQNPALSLVKALTDAPDPIVAGSVLQYTVTATNTGNITLTNVVVNDPLLTPDTQTCPTLAPSATCVLTGTLTVTQAQIDAGEIVNTATGDSDETDEQDDTVTTPVGQNPALSLVKALTDAPDPIVAGSVLQYTVTATNTGNITLTNVVVNDPLLTPNTQTCPSIAPTATCVLTGTLTVTQAQIDAGEIVNTATADSDETDEQEDTVTTPVGQNPALSLVKALTDAPDPIVVGSVLQYTVTATNTGNVSLTNVVVNDPLLTPDTQTCPTLAPGATCVLTGTLTVTQAQIDAGEIVNTATADSDETDEQDDTVTTPVGQNPALDLVKTITGGDPYANVGDAIDYELVATNTGNVVLSNVTIVDPLLPALTCAPAQPATLAPGESLVCTGSYTVDQNDIDTGSVVNTANASGTGPGGQPVEDEDSASATGPGGTPALGLVKVLSNAPNPIVAGSVLQYTITATNTGQVSLHDVLVVDTMITPDSIHCPLLLPTQTCVLTGTYTVTPADVTAGQVLNVAIATGTDPGGNPVPETETSVNTPVGGGQPTPPQPVPTLSLMSLLMLMLMIGLVAGGPLRRRL